METGKSVRTTYPVVPIILPPDRYLVTKTMGDQVQTISSCMKHLPATMAELATVFVDIQRVPPDKAAMHDCMGCLKGWKHADDT
jgi:hypothetical protein